MRRWLCLLWLCAAHSAWALTVYDDVGHPVTLNGSAQRIVSLAPSITENLFAIGAGERVVGTSSATDYPQAAQSIEVVSDFQNINLERVAALKPDVIVAWFGGNSPAQLAALSQLNIPIYMHRVRTLPEIPLALMRLAQLTELESAAAPTILAAYAKINLLHNAPLPTLKAFHQVWHTPLMTLNQSNWLSDALQRCGAVNIFADASIAAPVVNIEHVLQKNPDVILTTTQNALPNNDLDMWRPWQDVSAVKHQGLLFLDADGMSRATLRTLDTAQTMCHQIAAVRAHL